MQHQVGCVRRQSLEKAELEMIVTKASRGIDCGRGARVPSLIVTLQKQIRCGKNGASASQQRVRRKRNSIERKKTALRQSVPFRGRNAVTGPTL